MKWILGHSGEFVHRFRLIAASAGRRSTGMVIINQLAEMSSEERNLR